MDPYIRIVEAAKKNKGVRLTAREVFVMSLDDAIFTRAMFVSEKLREKENEEG